MSINLLSALQQLFIHDELLEQAAHHFNIPPGKVQQSMQLLAAATLKGYAGNQQASLPELTAQAAQESGTWLSDLQQSLLHPNHSQQTLSDQLQKTLWAQPGEVLQMLAGKLQVPVDVLQGLSHGIVPVTAGILGNKQKNEQLSWETLQLFIQSQMGTVNTLLPEALPTATPAEAPVPEPAVVETPVPQPDTSEEEAVHHRRINIWKRLAAVAIFAIVAGGAWYLLKGYYPQSQPLETAPPVDSTLTDTIQVQAAPVDTSAVSIIDTTGKSRISLLLPDSSSIMAFENSLEDSLVKFMKNPNGKAGKTAWFNFDAVVFETGSAVVNPASNQQLRNLAQILKAYSGMKIKIGGYTDNTGDSTTNVNLSQTRANAVWETLKGMGVTKQITAAEGYGPLHPVGDNATAEGRQQNRRIAINVQSKW